MGTIKINVSHELEEIMGPYLDNRKKDIQTLEVAIVEKDFHTITVVGHKMSGAARSYGFPQLEEIGEKLEDAGKQKKADDVRKLLRDLKDFLANVEIVFTDDEL